MGHQQAEGAKCMVGVAISVPTVDTERKGLRSTEETRLLEERVNKTSKRKVSIRQLDMPEAWVMEVVATANTLLDKKNMLESDMAEVLMKMFDDKKLGYWNCIVGRKYGSRVTHEGGHFLYLHIGTEQAIILFRTAARENENFTGQ